MRKNKSLNQLKIGIITHNFPFSENERKNAGIFVYDFAKILADKANVIALSPGPSDAIKNIGGIRTYFFKFNNKLGNLKIYNPLDFYKFIVFFYKGRLALEKFIKENSELDFIIAMWAFPSGYFAHRVFKSFGIPYAIYSLGSDIYVYAKKPFLGKIIKKYLADSKILFADSPDLVKEIYKLSGKKSHFLPSSSSVDSKFSPEKAKNPKLVFTFLGRLEKVKGIDIFFEALDMIKKDKNKFVVNIIGDGTLFEYIKSKARSFSNIKLWGNLNDFNKISEILRKSDWLIIPSRSDSIPLVFSEAMKISLPVIVSDLPDLKYLVHKYKVGKIFKQESISGLAKILREILQGKISSKNFTANTAVAAEIFDLKKSSAKLLELIRKNIK